MYIHNIILNVMNISQPIKIGNNRGIRYTFVYTIQIRVQYYNSKQLIICIKVNICIVYKRKIFYTLILIGSVGQIIGKL